MKVDKSKWVETAFAEIATSQLGKTLDANKNKGLPYPYLCAANVGMGYFNLSNVKEILLEDSELEKYLVRKGDLLICEGGDTGRCSIWESEDPIYYQNALHRVRFNDDIHNKFIMYYLHYYKKVGIIDKLSHGQTIKHFTQKGLSKLSFRMPTISEQKGITSELDAIQTMIDGYKAHISDFDELAKSLFLDTLGDPVINEKKWQIKSLSSLCNKMSTGPFGSMLHKSDYVVEGIPSVNPQNIKGSKVVIDGIAKVSYQKAEELSKYYLKENDIILARRGDLSKCAIITLNEQGWLCGTGSFFLHIEEVLPIVFYYQFTSKSIQKQLLEKSIGTTMPNLNQGILSKLMIPVPPIDIQQKFASQIEAIEKQKAILCEQLADAEQLMAERMQYYFS